MDDENLLRNAYHSLRSPLGSIYNVTEMLLLGLDGPLSDGVRESVACIADDARRLHRASEALLEYLRAVERPLHPQPVNIVPVVREAVATAQPQAIKAGKTIACPAKPRLLRLTTDDEAFYDLSGYLLGYAIRFGSEPVVKVTLEANRRQLSLYVGDKPVGEGDSVPLPEILTQDEAGVTLLTVRHLAARLGGGFHVQQTQDGHLGLSLRFPRSTPIRESLKRSPEK